MGFLKNMGVRKTLYISFYILLLATFHKKCCKYLGLSVTFSNFYNCFLKNMHPWLAIFLTTGLRQTMLLIKNFAHVCMSNLL